MVNRVWLGYYDGCEAIDLTSSNFDAIELACGQKFSLTQKARIQVAIDDYYYWQSWEWSSPRPRTVRCGLQKLGIATSDFNIAWRELQSGLVESAEHVHEQLARQFTLIPRNSPEQRVACPEACDDTWIELDRYVSLDFDIWLKDTIRRVELLMHLTVMSEIHLQRDHGGPTNAKNQFGPFVLSLADVYKDAGGKIGVTSDPTIDAYRHNGFLGLVHSALLVLPVAFQYTGLSLGKTVQTILNEFKNPTLSGSSALERTP